MRIEKAQNGYFIETIHGTWIYKDFDGVVSFMRTVFDEAKVKEDE